MREALGACRSAFVSLFVFSLVINLLALTSSLYMMQVYDRVLASRNQVTLSMLTGMALAALLAMAGLELVRGRAMVRIVRFRSDGPRHPAPVPAAAAWRARSARSSCAVCTR